MPSLSQLFLRNASSSRILLSALLLCISTFPVHAIPVIPIPNTEPTILGPDIDGSGFFVPTGDVATAEFFDLGGFALGGTFGFFFESDPATLITVFDPLDQDPDPSGLGSIPQIAVIDFAAGTVTDADTIGGGPGLQATFTATGNIGFFFTPNPAFAIPTLFTVPALNAGGDDLVATFPFLGPPVDDFLIAFEAPPGSPIVPPGSVVALEFTLGVIPSPEPGTLLLVGSGLVGLLGYGRKRRIRS